MTTTYDVLGAAPGTALAPAWHSRRPAVEAVVAGPDDVEVGVSRLGDVRGHLRGLDVRSCVDVFERALSLSDESAVQRLVRSAVRTSHAC
jgi:hypothetical protein